MSEPAFVRAVNKLTGDIQRIPAHWLADGSPFPHFKPLPSTRRTERQATKTAEPAGNPKATGDAGSADTPKEQ